MNNTALLLAFRPAASAAYWLMAFAVASAGGSTARGASPEIFSLNPPEGIAGTTIRVKGAGFKQTKQVLFFTAFSYKPAKYSVISDSDLDVVAPDYWTGDTRATVVVLTTQGVTVGLPAGVVRVSGNYERPEGERTTYQVIKGGHMSSAAGTVLIEDGGTVGTCHRGVVSFVANGGTLTFLENPAGIIFYERGAILGQEMTGPPVKNSYACRTLIEVREIVPSVGIDEFVFQALPAVDDKPRSTPQIRSFTPTYGYSGDIVTLSGKGFQGTTEVYLADGLSDPERSASFQVESDRVMNVQVPDDKNFYQYIIVVNPLGAAVTVPPPNLKNVFHAERGNLNFRFVHAGEIVPGNMNIGCFIEKGGLAEHKTSVAFVKNGGRIVEVPDFMLYEPGAAIPPASDRQKKHHHEVPHLEASHVPSLFYKMTMHDLLEDGVFPRKSASQQKGRRRP